MGLAAALKEEIKQTGREEELGVAGEVGKGEGNASQNPKSQTPNSKCIVRLRSGAPKHFAAGTEIPRDFAARNDRVGRAGQSEEKRQRRKQLCGEIGKRDGEAGC